MATQDPPKSSGKAVYSIIKTPKAPVSYVYLAKPDTKFKADGTYSVTLVLDPKNPEHQAFITKLTQDNQEVFNRRIKNIKRDKDTYRVKKLFKSEYVKNKETGEETETGLMTLKIATKVNTFAVFGPDGKTQIPKESLKNIGSGSTCKVIVSLKEHDDNSKGNIGYVCYLSKIQFIDIKKWTPSDAGGDFGAEEGTRTLESTSSSPTSEGSEESTDGPTNF